MNSKFFINNVALIQDILETFPSFINIELIVRTSNLSCADFKKINFIEPLELTWI